MATRKIAYAAAASITGTLTSLASAGWRQTTAVDNTSNLYIDALVGGITQLGAPSVNGTMEIYAYGSWDSTNYTCGLSGSDGTITWGTNTGVLGYNDLIPLGVANTEGTDDNDDVEWGPFPLAAAFGGRMPPKWGLVFKDNTGATLHATGTNNAIKYTGITETIA